MIIKKIFFKFYSLIYYLCKNIEKCFKPLFDTKDIPLNITMKDFFTLTNIDIHMYSFEINE